MTGNKCIKIVAGDANTGVKWGEAREACIQYGGDLASIASEEENCKYKQR